MCARLRSLSVRLAPPGELLLAYGINNLFVLRWQPLGHPTTVLPTHNPNNIKLSLELGKVVAPRGWHLGEYGWRGFCAVLRGKKLKKVIKFY